MPGLKTLNKIKLLFYFFLVVAVSACNTKQESLPGATSLKESSTISNSSIILPEKKPINGKLLKAKSFLPLKVVLAGKSRVVPFKNNIHAVGEFDFV